MIIVDFFSHAVLCEQAHVRREREGREIERREREREGRERVF